MLHLALLRCTEFTIYRTDQIGAIRICPFFMRMILAVYNKKYWYIICKGYQVHVNASTPSCIIYLSALFL